MEFKVSNTTELVLQKIIVACTACVLWMLKSRINVFFNRINHKETPLFGVY